MGKVKSKTVVMAWQDLFNFEIYKPTQGRIVRQATALALVLIVGTGVWKLIGELSDTDTKIRLGIPLTLGVVAGWLIFRMVNRPRFADFLISTEAEMAKVSWPSRPELFRATGVVLVTMLVLAAALFMFDIIWQTMFQWLGVLQF